MRIFFNGFNELRGIAASAAVVCHIELFNHRAKIASLYDGYSRSFIDHLDKNGVRLLNTRLNLPALDSVITPENTIAYNVLIYLCTFTLTILISYLSFRYYESFFLRMKERFVLVPSGKKV
jgi:hypothetical protein